MKKVILTIAIALITMGVSGCGGGTTGAGGAVDIIIEACATPDDIASYTALQSADKVVDDSGDAVIKTFHTEDGDRSICLSAGDAHIER